MLINFKKVGLLKYSTTVYRNMNHSICKCFWQMHIYTGRKLCALWFEKQVCLTMYKQLQCFSYTLLEKIHIISQNQIRSQTNKNVHFKNINTNYSIYCNVQFPVDQSSKYRFQEINWCCCHPSTFNIIDANYLHFCGIWLVSWLVSWLVDGCDN